MSTPPIGFPAQPERARLARLVADLRARAERSREEAVTGLRSDPARALRGRVNELLGVDRALGETTQYLGILDLAEARAGVMQTSLGALRGFAVDLARSGQTALDSGPRLTGETVSMEARQALEAAVSALNVSYGGRSLFAGNAGDRPAVAGVADMLSALRPVVEAAATGGQAYADLTVAFTAPGGLFDTDFYLGGTGDAPAAEIAPGERLAYAPRADAAPVRRLLRDLAALALAYDPEVAIDDGARDALARNAVAGLRGNVEGLTAMSARLGSAQARMAAVRTRHRATESTLQQSHLSLAGRDQFEAASEVTSLEAQLQTSYLATARLARLSLANFLR